MTFSEEQDRALFQVNMVSSTLSFCGALIVVVSFVYFSELRTFAFRLIFFIALSDMFGSLGRLYGNPDSEGWCQLQSFQTNIFDLCSFFWVASVATVINYVRISNTFDGDRYMQKCHMVIWPSALIISILPFTTKSYGPAGGWCWIENEDTTDKVWRIAAFYGQLVLVFGYLVYVYVRLYLFLASDARPTLEAKALLSKVIYFPLVLFVTYFFGVFRRVFEICGGETPFWLAFVHIGLSALLGFGNALVYGVINSELRNHLIGSCVGCVNGPGITDPNEMDTPKKSKKSNRNEKVDLHIDDGRL